MFGLVKKKMQLVKQQRPQCWKKKGSSRHRRVIKDSKRVRDRVRRDREKGGKKGRQRERVLFLWIYSGEYPLCLMCLPYLWIEWCIHIKCIWLVIKWRQCVLESDKHENISQTSFYFSVLFKIKRRRLLNSWSRCLKKVLCVCTCI